MDYYFWGNMILPTPWILTWITKDEDFAPLHSIFNAN